MTMKEKVPPIGRRERKRKAKIAKILKVAMDLVVKGGLDALTIHETSFFRHKESFDLVQHVCQQKIIQSCRTLARFQRWRRRVTR